MITDNFYEGIFKRKSVRKYTQDILDQQTLDEIKAFSNSVTRLLPEINTEIRIVSKEEIKIIMPIKAPHYVMFYSEKKDGYLMNAGYMLQQIDLFLSVNRLGSCYLGLAQPTKVARENSDLDFVIVLAFGNPLETVHRLSLSAFNRKSHGEIAHHINDEHFYNIIEAARVAPSAGNSQPWFFAKEEDLIHVYRNKANMVKAFLYEKMNQIDIGIALYHLELRLNYNNESFEFIKDESKNASASKNQEYMMSLSIK